MWDYVGYSVNQVPASTVQGYLDLHTDGVYLSRGDASGFPSGGPASTISLVVGGTWSSQGNTLTLSGFPGATTWQFIFSPDGQAVDLIATATGVPHIIHLQRAAQLQP